MDQNEIKELIEFLVETDIAEFELERGDFKIRVKRASASLSASGTATADPPAASRAPVPSPVPLSAPAAAASEAGIEIVKSPIVGTFFEASSPGAPAFVKQGDSVAVGQVLCIVEAMKLLNEIESETAGQIVEILVANGQPVEYGQPLFKIRTT
jgi:acetyl-CoA carboxylase biotin carboxyl carrier protein